jgi:uncharacterized spore protein YtfJ
MPKDARITVEDLMTRIGQLHHKATVKTVFGDPMTMNGRTIIPVANVRYAFGVGMGRGKSEKQEGSGEGGGGGGGGGGGVMIRPVAILEIGDQDTRVKPIPDVTRLALAAMALVAWNLFWITYTMRRVAPRR